jgi:RND superfamily putative drug exporter
MMLVPSIMEILGDANWWFPKWLGFLPRLDLEGKNSGATAAPSEPDDRVPVGV